MANLLTLDGFDECVIGIAQRAKMQPVVAYDKVKVLALLMRRDSLTVEQANEYFDEKLANKWTGQLTPVFLTACDIGDIHDAVVKG